MRAHACKSSAAKRRACAGKSRFWASNSGAPHINHARLPGGQAEQALHGPGFCSSPASKLEIEILRRAPIWGCRSEGRPPQRAPDGSSTAPFAPQAPCAGPYQAALALLQSGPPEKPGACVSPERAYYRQSSQEALKKSAACITCPAARKRAPFIQDYLSGNRKVVNLFSFRSMLEAKAFLLSPALLGDGVSLKLTKTRKKPLPAGRGFFL